MEPAWVAAGVAGVVLALQIFRLSSTFAEKASVLKTADSLQLSVVKTADELRALVEHTAVARATETQETFDRFQKTLDEILAEAKSTNGRVRKLEDWTLKHEVKDQQSQSDLRADLDRLCAQRKRAKAKKKTK